MVEILFNGHAGRLEGRYHKSEKPDAPVALILHPHPQYGGTMNNKVVYSLFSCFKDLGFTVILGCYSELFCYLRFILSSCLDVYSVYSFGRLV